VSALVAGSNTVGKSCSAIVAGAGNRLNNALPAVDQTSKLDEATTMEKKYYFAVAVVAVVVYIVAAVPVADAVVDIGIVDIDVVDIDVVDIAVVDIDVAVVVDIGIVGVLVVEIHIVVVLVVARIDVDQLVCQKLDTIVENA